MTKQKQSSGGKFVLGALIGAAAGAITALLTAPKSGQETRKDIKDKATEVSHEAIRTLRKLEGELNKRISDAKKQVNKLEGQAKDDLEKLIVKAEKTKDQTLRMIDNLKADTKNQLDEKFMTDAREVIAELQALRERINERHNK